MAEHHVVQCTIKPKEGSHIHKSSEIVGEGKVYLSCLSEKLLSMKTDVNAILTEIVDKEKAAIASGNKAGGSSAAKQRKEDDDEEMEEEDDTIEAKRPKT